MAPVRSLFLALALLVPLATPGCADASGDDEQDGETEPMGQTADELRSGVACKTTRMTAYQKGKAFPIDVIEIGGKRVAKATGHAFLKMQKAADAAGVKLSISSGFRTNDEQKYFYDCYETKKCNGGNLAAKPGYSNHQSGHALDLSTSSWLSKHAASFGFSRTVPSEAWHYEFAGADPGGPCSGKTATADDAPLADDASSDAPPAPTRGAGATCGSDGQCNPGADGSGLICEDRRCVTGCRTDAHCPGATACVDGRCQ